MNIFAEENASEQALRAASEPAEGEAEDTAAQQGGWSEGEPSPAEEITLPQIITHVDTPVAEQRQVFTAEDIENEHIDDLPELVERAGIQILSYGTYGLEQKPSIRGFTDETVRVVIDGQCVNNAQSGTFDFSSINIDSIEKVEIVRGGFTEGTEDEGAVGGVIYITTKKQAGGKSFNFDSSVTSYANLKTSPLTLDTFSQKAGFSAQLSENSFLKTNAAFTYAQNRFLYKDFENKITTQKDSGVKDGSADLNFTRYFGKGNYFSISDRFYKGKKNCPGKVYLYDEGLQKDTDNCLSLTLYNPAIKDALNLKNILSYSKQHRSWQSRAEDSLHKYDDIKYSLSADLYSLKKIKQSAGFSFEWTHLNSTNSGIHDQFSLVFKETTKLFVNDWLSFTLPLGIKSCGKNFAFLPKIGAGAKFSKIEILLDGYRMIQFPNMDDLYWRGAGYYGNPDLKPERGWGADLTFNFKNQILPSSLQFFTNYYWDKICWSSTTTKNEKSAFYFGIDFNAEKSLFNDHLALSAGGEYLYNRLTDKSEAGTYGNRIMWTPDWTANLSAKVNFSKADFTVSASHMGKRYLSNLNITYLEPYTLFNLSFNLKLWEHIKPYLKIDNIFNTSYQSIDDYAMPGRSIKLGIRGKW